MEKLKIYVGCGLMHASAEYKQFIVEFKKRLREELPHEILEFVSNPHASPEEIYRNDIGECVPACHVIIADLTHASLGLGYELGTQIESLKKPVILFAKAGSIVSRLIIGIPGVTILYYKSLDEMVLLAKEALSKITVRKKGKLIVIDGTDGSGKATQTKELVIKLQSEGKHVETFDFPHPTNHFGTLIYESLGGKHGDFAGMSPRIASALYAADRFESSKKIKDWLEAGAVVVLDRYVSANQIHQGGKIHDDEERKKFLQWLDHMEHEIFQIPRPDIIIYLDVPVEISQKLAKEKESLAKKSHYQGIDQHEDDIEHLRNAKESGLKMIAELSTWTRIQCYENGEMLSVNTIHNQVWNLVSGLVS